MHNRQRYKSRIRTWIQKFKQRTSLAPQNKTNNWKKGKPHQEESCSYRYLGINQVLLACAQMSPEATNVLTIITIPTCVDEAGIHPNTLPGITISHASTIRFLTRGVKSDFFCFSAGFFFSDCFAAEESGSGKKMLTVDPITLNARPKNHHLWHSRKVSWAQAVGHIPIASNYSLLATNSRPQGMILKTENLQ